MEDVNYFLHSINEKEMVDSVFLMEVKSLLELRKENQAEQLLDQKNEWFARNENHKCTFLLLKNHARLLSGRYDSLNEPNCGHGKHLEQWRIQLLAKSLFLRSTEEFDMVFQSAKCSDPILSVVEFALYVQKEDILRTPKKSRFLAGFFSSIIPGTGKLYAGKPREAVYAFLPVAFNLAQAGEGYYRKQLDSPHFYFFGSLTALFYTSNIYGSAMAAKRRNVEVDFRVNNNIEFEISKLTKYY
ncbi:MAG TPA: hypothetical protein PLU73_01655 [Bacteroidia bacterium]|nr:hypothetical protein [Bacteroidia bacterium]